MLNASRKDASDFVETRKIVDAIVRWWWLLIVAAIVGALIGRVVSQRQTPVYGATTTLLVGQSIQSAELDSRDIAVSERLAQTYAQLARLQPVLQSVIETLELDTSWQDLAQRVVSTPSEGTQLLRITAQASSPAEAQMLADEIAAALISVSPTAVRSVGFDDEQRFALRRLGKLRANIEKGQQQIDELQSRMIGSNSASKQEIQSEIDVLQNLVLGWEENYTRLLALAVRDGSPNFLTVVEPAQPTSSPIRPRTLLNMFVMAAAGFMLALVLVVFREFQDDTVRTPIDLGQALEMDTLGTIGHIRGENKLITVRDPLSTIAEAYAVLPSKIKFRNGNQLPKTIMITSPNRDEGKSVTAANLSVVMAQAGYKIIVVDTYLLHPALYQIFNVPDQGGILDVLQSDSSDFERQLKYTDNENLKVLTRGTMPNGSSIRKDDSLSAQRTIAQLRPQLLATHLDQIVTSLSGLADVIIFDSPPLLTSAEAIDLSGQVDGVVLVLRAGRTRETAARQAVVDLRLGGANVIGGILNQASVKRRFGSRYRDLWTGLFPRRNSGQ